MEIEGPGEDGGDRDNGKRIWRGDVARGREWEMERGWRGWEIWGDEGGGEEVILEERGHWAGHGRCMRMGGEVWRLRKGQIGWRIGNERWETERKIGKGMDGAWG